MVKIKELKDSTHATRSSSSSVTVTNTIFFPSSFGAGGFAATTPIPFFAHVVSSFFLETKKVEMTEELRTSVLCRRINNVVERVKFEEEEKLKRLYRTLVLKRKKRIHEV